jgi:hypothetical protein
VWQDGGGRGEGGWGPWGGSAFPKHDGGWACGGVGRGGWGGGGPAHHQHDCKHKPHDQTYLGCTTPVFTPLSHLVSPGRCPQW